MEYQELPNATVEEADIVIQRVAFGGSVSGGEGTQFAPDAILEISEQIEYYDEDMEWSPMQYMRVHVSNSVSEYSQIKSHTDSLKQPKKQLIISLGGDHSITPKITESLLEQPATILFLDAHADLRESYMGNPFSHATPSHHLLKAGHKMIMVGIRSLFESEAQRVKSDPNIAYFSDRALRKESVRNALFETIRAIDGDLYLSIDMDAFSPALVPSVGTPQPGGLDYYFVTDILEVLFFESNALLKGVDMVELIPEPSTVSQTFAANLLQKIISYWGKAEGFDSTPKDGSQMDITYE
jgi:agmatinase